MLGEVLSSFAYTKDAQRNNGNLINNLPWLLPGSSEERHQPIKGPFPKIQKGTEV